MTGTLAPPRHPRPAAGRPRDDRGRPEPAVARLREDATLPGTLALSALTLSVAVGFGRLFNDRSFLVPVVLVAVTSHVVAWWCRRRQVPTALAAIATIGATALVGAWTLLGETTFYGLPLPATLAAGAEAMASARGLFSVIKAPAPVLPGFLLAAVLALGVVAFMGDWAAFRLRATFEALIPGFSLFLFTAALGTSRHRSWAIAIFMISALAFLAVQRLAKGQRTNAFTGNGGVTASTLRTAAVLGAVALIVGLAVGPRLPGAGDPPLVKYKNRSRPGPSNRATISPLVDIRGRLVEQAGIEVFTVRTAQRSYWRLTSLDTFNGVIWSSQDTYRPTSGRIAAGESLRPELAATASEQAFSIQNLASIWLPAAFRPTRIEGLEDVSYNRDTASLITPAETTDGVQYTVESAIPSLSPEQLSTAPARAPEAIASRYLALPDVSRRVANEARTITAGARTPYDKAMALQQYFRTNFRYDLTARAGHDSRALENFLFRTKRGYCEQFAGAYAVLARLVGLPARVGVGFTPGELRPDGQYQVRDEHAHAWPEIYLHGYGWVAFEPTPGRGAPGAEAYTGVPESQDTTGPSTSATTTPPVTTPAADDTAPTTTPESSTATSAPATTPEVERPIPRWVLVAAGLTAVVVAWLTVVPALHRRRRGRRRAGAGGRAKVLAAWQDTTEVLGAAGVARLPTETMTEYARRAARTAGLSEQETKSLRDLAGDAAAAAYGSAEPGDEVVERARQAADRVQQAVLDEASLGERARRWLDPRPLVGASAD